MRVLVDKKMGICTLVPVEDEEEKTLAAIIKVLKQGDKIVYKGRDDGNGKEKPYILYFYAGARCETQTIGNSTRDVFIGGVKLNLYGSTEGDIWKVKGIRDMCFFHSGGLIFLDEAEVDGKISIIVTALPCTICGGKMFSPNWVCDICATKCDHQYEVGLSLHPFGLKRRHICTKCGRIIPEDQE